MMRLITMIVDIRFKDYEDSGDNDDDYGDGKVYDHEIKR